MNNNINDEAQAQANSQAKTHELFKADCNLYGYGVCITCGVNAGPLCTPCFADLRRKSFIKKLKTELETIEETDEKTP